MRANKCSGVCVVKSMCHVMEERMHHVIKERMHHVKEERMHHVIEVAWVTEPPPHSMTSGGVSTWHAY